jgi:lipid-A-disaccharide synthase
MKYYIVAGEASGDLHGSNLIRALKSKDSAAEVRCWGGDLMESAGATLVRHYRELAFMGFLEVVRHLRTILRLMKNCKADILAWQPDVLILIDYPGFNLRLAQWAKKNGLRVVYYISPQIWAWHTSRVKIVRDFVDRMIVILPFEQEFYARHGVQVEYVGHPLLDVVEGYEAGFDFRQKFSLSDLPVVALLPGSRKQEIAKMLPLMLSVVSKYPHTQFIIAGAPSVDEEFYRRILARSPVQGFAERLKIITGATYPLLQVSTGALVTSGTATLETALFGVPEIVCYRGNPVSFWLAKRLVKVRFISLVNLIADREIIPELIQHDLNEENLAAQLSRILLPDRNTTLREELGSLRNLIGPSGASERAAALIVDWMRRKSV